MRSAPAGSRLPKPASDGQGIAHHQARDRADGKRQRGPPVFCRPKARPPRSWWLPTRRAPRCGPDGVLCRLRPTCDQKPPVARMHFRVNRNLATCRRNPTLGEIHGGIAQDTRLLTVDPRCRDSIHCPVRPLPIAAVSATHEASALLRPYFSYVPFGRFAIFVQEFQ